jgi:PDZ domain-containing protein
VVVAFAVAVLLPVPYVILSPGPTINTLGSAGHRPLIKISGHRTYPANGHLNLVTVTFRGGPIGRFNAFTALRAWLSSDNAVVPQEELFGPGLTKQQVQQQDTQQMVSSQQAATAAALCQLRIRFATLDTVVQVRKGMPAEGVLRKGDVITGVNGRPVTCHADSADLISALRPGSPVALTVRRGSQVRQLRLTTASIQGRTVVGVGVIESYRFPFPVNFNLSHIGGPSAGLMFALGIVDKLSPARLTGGRFIAGTGEISAEGQIGAIGGIQQKVVAARDAGATIFLAPAANCSEAAGAAPAGLRLVKVSTLAGAVQALHSIAAGRPVPGC